LLQRVEEESNNFDEDNSNIAKLSLNILKNEVGGVFENLN